MKCANCGRIGDTQVVNGAGTTVGYVCEREPCRAWAKEQATINPTPKPDQYADSKVQMAAKSQRVPLDLVCIAGVAHEAQAMRDGLLKYGYASFLNDNIEITSRGCIAAAMRHLGKLLSGVDKDPSGAHHAGHARAMLGIYLERMEAGTLVDDRHPAHKRDAYIERMMDRMFEENRSSDTKRFAGK